MRIILQMDCITITASSDSRSIRTAALPRARACKG